MSNEKKADGQKAGTVKIKLLSYLSGKDESFAPGHVLDVDATEAERLIGLGAAVEHKEEAKAEEKA
jgi:hypothetical protein